MPVDVKARHGLRLPVELLDMILKDMETETQKACSLVCRVWLDVSRRHLFESTVFRTTTSFDAFLEFLTAHPHISVLIRDLYLFGPTAGVPKNIPSLSPLTLIDIATLMPNVSYITLETVQIVNVPNTDDTKARLASLSGPTRLTEFNLTDCAVGHEVEHSPVAIVHLFHLLEAEVMKIELTCGWAPFPVTNADTDLPLIVVPWRVRHQGICMKKILDTRPTHLSALSQILVPGSLRLLHLSFTEWAHFDEMSRFLRHFGESITEFTITFGYALHNYCYRHHRRAFFRLSSPDGSSSSGLNLITYPTISIRRGVDIVWFLTSAKALKAPIRHMEPTIVRLRVREPRLGVYHRPPQVPRLLPP